MNTTASNVAVLETLRDARSALIDSALEVLSAQQRTLLNQALAHSFVDAYLDAVADQHPARLAVWVEAKAAKATRQAEVAGFLNDAGQALAEFVDLKEFGEFAAAPLRALRSIAPQASDSPEHHAAVHDVDATINEIVRCLSDGDAFAGDHAREVCAWTKRLARRLGLDAESVVFAGNCALVHDMGELALPPGIVSTPRLLQEEEIALVRTHVFAGEGQALADPFLAPFASAIRSHHERYDGSGYPDRLRGEAIPLTARIVAVADSFNAMVGRRPYREAVTASEALERMRLGAGAQFDPEIVSALEAILKAR